MQGKLLLKTIQKNVVTHKSTENIQKRRKAQKSINKITKNAKKRRKTNKNIEQRMKTWKKAEKHGKMKKCTKKYPSGGTLGSPWARFGCSWALWGRSWALLGRSWKPLGRCSAASWTQLGKWSRGLAL